MDLQKLIDMQKTLDTRIREEKGLQGKDLTANTFVALQAELAEFANEGRWFKHWSNDREPRKFKEIPMNEIDGSIPKGFNVKNPLLEEFVDGVHFFLSLAIQKDWEEALWIFEEQLDPDEFDGDLTGWYLEMTYFLNKSYMVIPTEEQDQSYKNSAGFSAKQYWFRIAWILFLNIGVNGFGFTLEQIEQAYMDKNKTNHSRQDTGY